MKRSFLSILLLLTLHFSFGQKSFMFGVGITGFDNQIMKNNTITNAKSVGGIGIVYYPRWTFVETKKHSIGFGIPLYVGVGLNVATRSYIDEYGYEDEFDNTTMGYILNVPVLATYSFGRGSTDRNRDPLGFFVGAGVGYNASLLMYDDATTGAYYDDNRFVKLDNGVGPAVSAGLRIGVGRWSNIEIAASYMKAFTAGQAKIIGARVVYNL